MFLRRPCRYERRTRCRLDGQAPPPALEEFHAGIEGSNSEELDTLFILVTKDLGLAAFNKNLESLEKSLLIHTMEF